MDTCEVCGDVIVIMINRGSGVCTEECRGIYADNPPPARALYEDVEDFLSDYDYWSTEVRRIKREKIDARQQAEG